MWLFALGSMLMIDEYLESLEEEAEVIYIDIELEAEDDL